MSAMGTLPSSFDSPDSDVPAPGRGGGDAGSRGPGGRVVGLDVARSLAIIGMIAVNVGPRGAEGPLGWAYDIPLGRASLLFIVLAGVGMSIMTRKSRDPGGAPVPWGTVLWRAALLLVGGLALQLLDHGVSVILPLYGLLFVACLPLLRAPTWLVATLAGTSLVFGPLFWIAVRFGSDAFEVTDPGLLHPPGEILTGILFTGSYPAVVWAAPFLLGMVLGRLDLRNPALHRQLITWGAVSVVSGFLLSRLLILLVGDPGRTVTWDRLISATGHSQMPLWLISSTGAGLLVLGLCLMGERSLPRRLPALAATGRLSLTVYAGHLLALAAIVRPGPDSLTGGIVTTVALSAAAIVFAWLWTRRFRTGPLEVLLRLPRH